MQQGLLLVYGRAMDEQPKIQQVGTLNWPRYRIVLGQCAWTGKGWDSNDANALLFASMKDVVKRWQEVMHLHFGHLRQLKLTTTVTVTVRVGDGFRRGDLAEYLNENAYVQLDQRPILLDAAILDFDVDWPGLKVEGNQNDIFE
jgi:hypothetical protein